MNECSFNQDLFDLLNKEFDITPLQQDMDNLINFIHKNHPEPEKEESHLYSENKVLRNFLTIEENKNQKLLKLLNDIKRSIIKNASDTIWFDESTTTVDYIDFSIEQIIQDSQLFEQKPAK